MKFLVRYFFITISLLLVPVSQPAQAIELGLTPSDVFGLWSNINRIVVDYGKSHLSDHTAIRNLVKIQGEHFSDKTPSDVLGRVNQFSQIATPLSPATHGKDESLLLEEKIVFLIRHNKTETTPSVVYMRSIDVLIALAQTLLLPANKLPSISSYFVDREYKDKTPSDVYGLVILATNRLEFIIRQNSFDAHPAISTILDVDEK
jgi:hypothetical protein